MLPKEGFGGGIHPVGPVTKLGDVQVHLEDASLWPEELEEDSEVGFEPLADIAPTFPEEEILGDLLGDGARPADAGPRPLVFDGPGDRLEVEAPVARELLVFGRDHGNTHGRGNLCPSCPAIANGGALSGDQVGETSPKHEGTRGRRHEGQIEDRGGGGAGGPPPPQRKSVPRSPDY